MTILTLRFCAAIILLVSLASCNIPKNRLAYDWEEYTNAQPSSYELFAPNYSVAWTAVQGTASDLEMRKIAEDRNSGIVTFIKPDEEWDNTTHHLTVRIIEEDFGVLIYIRGLSYATFGQNYEMAGPVFPSDGDLEANFVAALRIRL